MDGETNHYVILGLHSSGGEKGAKYSEKEITTAFKKKALKIHPDKRPVGDAEKAKADIQSLNASYAILNDEKLRKLYDESIIFLRAKKLDKAPRWHSQQHDAKRQKMMSELDRKERGTFAFDPEKKARKEAEERISREFDEEVASIIAECQRSWSSKVDLSKKDGLRSRMRDKENTSGLETSSTSTTQEPRPLFGSDCEADILNKMLQAGQKQKTYRAQMI